METEITKTLKDFGAKIGLTTPLDLGEEGTVRLNLTEDWGIDFEADPDGKRLWIYLELFPGVDMTQGHHLFTLLRHMFTHHRDSNVQLTIDPDGFSLILVSLFSSSWKHEETPLVDLLDNHLQEAVRVAESLRSSIDKQEEHYTPPTINKQFL